MKNWKILLALLTANVVLMSSASTMLVPFLPIYLIRELGVSPDRVHLWNGAIFSVTFLISSIMVPFWGNLADKKGKRMMALRSSIGLVIAYFAAGLARTPEQMFAARVIQGFASGLSTMCLAIASGLLPSDELGVGLGILQSGFTCGTIVGPLLGSFLSTCLGMRASYFAAGILLSIVTLAIFFFIPEPPKHKTPKSAITRKALLQRPVIRDTLIYVAVIQISIFLIQPVLSLHIAELNKGAGKLLFISGLVFSFAGVAGAITAPLWGCFGQRRGFQNALVLALLLSGVTSILNAVPESLLLFCFTNFAYALCRAGIQPSLSAMLASNTEQEHQGRVFGFMFAAQQFGSMAGPLLGGLMAGIFTLRYLFIFGGAAMLAISACAWLRRYE